MEKEEHKQLGLYMPSGLKLKKEYFPGFTKDCLPSTIIAAIICVIIDCLLWLCGIHNFAVMLLLFGCGTTTVVFMQIKGELNLSPIDIIKLEVQFAKSQKFYPYIAKNEWENIE